MMPPPWINEEFTAGRMEPVQMDVLWAAGWRRFRKTFFRYSMDVLSTGGLDTIVPLRIVLADFSTGRSQRRVLRRNADVEWEIRPASLTADVVDLFGKHRRRFTNNVPESLAVFLGENPGAGPCECIEFRCLLRGRLMAASFLDVGARSTSSVYAVFDPAESRRSPGILTMLREIEWARGRGMTHHHPGYTTPGAGVYEYKKQFRALEGYDWSMQQWRPWAKFESERSAGFPARELD